MLVRLRVRVMTSDSDDLEQQLRENLELRRQLAAEVDKARTASQRGGMARRLGWVLYWASAAVALGWAAVTLLMITTSFALANIQLGQWVVALMPPILLYGIGRAFRYILSGE